MSLGIRLVMCGVYAALAWLMKVACELHEPLMVWMVVISMLLVLAVDVVETVEYVRWRALEGTASKGELLEDEEEDEWAEEDRYLPSAHLRL